MVWFGIFRGIFVAVLIAGFCPVVASANDVVCTSDKPIKRTIVDYTKTVTCTAVFCSGALSCPEGDGPCRYVPKDCNTCSPWPTFEACFSAAEIEAAKPKGN